MAEAPETPEKEAAQDEQAGPPAQDEQASAAAETPASAEASAGEEPAAQETAAGGAEAAAEAEAPEQETASEAPAEPAEELSPKERRRRERSRHVGKPREPRSPQERHAERLAQRRTKASRRRVVRERQRGRRAAPGEASSVAPSAEPHAQPAGARAAKMRQGVVVSNRADKTITVRISMARRHRRYEKIVRSSRTLHAHDENNDAHEGDVVRLVESRPLSRTKRWRLVEVLERAQ